MGEQRALARDVLDGLSSAVAILEQAIGSLRAAVESMEGLDHALMLDRIEARPQPTVQVTEHRRLHRMGRVPKLDADPELRAFVVARLDCMTYVDIAQEVAAHFPKERRIGKSAIFDWHKRNREGI